MMKRNVQRVVLQGAAFLVTPVIKTILRLLCRIDAQELKKLPQTGPYVIVVNHVNFLEVPILYTFIRPRRLYSLIKAETWNNPFLRFLADIWDAIPLRRGIADTSALQAVRDVLERGDILILAPEGTRSGDGVLRRGHSGAVVLAYRNRVPVYPVVHVGGQRFYQCLRRMRRTPVEFRVGPPFCIDLNGAKGMPVSLRRETTTEMMGRLAALLPPEQRGVYAGDAEREPRFLRVFEVSPHGLCPAIEDE